LADGPKNEPPQGIFLKSGPEAARAWGCRNRRDLVNPKIPGKRTQYPATLAGSNDFA